MSDGYDPWQEVHELRKRIAELEECLRDVLVDMQPETQTGRDLVAYKVSRTLEKGKK